MTRQLISIVIPLYNEEESVPVLLKALQKAIRTCEAYDFEFVFIDDGSSDNSATAVNQLVADEPRLRLIEFSRNFGKEAAVSAGIHEAKGDAVIIMDADLQHPPQLIPDFVSKWEQGAEVVVGVRQADGKESIVKRVGSAVFYRIMQAISHTKITPHATDYRLLDRCVVDEFNRFTEHNRMSRGLIDWLGFRREYLYFEAPERQYGEASYTFRKLVGLALNSFTAYSLLPLRLAGYVGCLILLTSGPLAAFIVIEQYVMGDPMGLQISGTASLTVAVLFLVGIILACLGLVAMYIAHIHTEVIDRPLYVIRQKRPRARGKTTP